jgi:hypothetical protein
MQACNTTSIDVREKQEQSSRQSTSSAGQSGGGGGQQGSEQGAQDHGSQESSGGGDEGIIGESAQQQQTGGMSGGPPATGQAEEEEGSGAGPRHVGSAGSGAGHVTPDKNDVADQQDDDIVARQLREQAEQERDPELKEKLWDEYRRYKSG